MIKSIHIKNFKAIKNIKFDDLSHINYLVGPNGSGKSSILQCIQYIRAGYLRFGQKGDLIIDCLNSKNALQIASLFETNFCLEITQGIVKNRLDKYEEDIVKLIVKGKPQVESGKLIFKSPDTIDTTGSHKDFGGFFFENYTTIYLDTHNTSFDSDIIYKSPKLQYENTLSQEYISLTGNARTKVELQNALPDIKNLMEEIFNQQFKEHFLIEELSAGLRLLALIKSYIQKHIDKPSLMLFIEEPETSLHPGVQKNFPLMLEKLIEEELGKDKSKLQIFVTTHSPFIISGIDIPDIKPLKIPYFENDKEVESIHTQKVYLLEKGGNKQTKDQNNNENSGFQGYKGFESMLALNSLLGYDSTDMGYPENFCIVEEPSICVILDGLKDLGVLKNWVFISSSGWSQAEDFADRFNQMKADITLMKCNPFYVDKYVVLIDSVPESEKRGYKYKNLKELGQRFIELKKDSLEDYYESYCKEIYEAFHKEFRPLKEHQHSERGTVKCKYAGEILKYMKQHVNLTDEFKKLFNGELDFLLKQSTILANR